MMVRVNYGMPAAARDEPAVTGNAATAATARANARLPQNSRLSSGASIG